MGYTIENSKESSNFIVPGEKQEITRPPHRPTKLTPEVQDEILTNIKLGMHIEPACLAANITEQTYYNWLKWGKEQTEGIYHDFFESLKIAQGFAEKYHLEQLDCEEKGWQRHAWVLERRFRDRWGRAEKLEITNKDNESLLQELRSMDKSSRDKINEIVMNAKYNEDKKE